MSSSSNNSFGKNPPPPAAPGNHTYAAAVARSPTTTMTKVRPSDRGEAPATEPGAVRRDNSQGDNISQVLSEGGSSSAFSGVDPNRRDARRNKRQAARDKFHRASVDSNNVVRTSMASPAPGEGRASMMSNNAPYDDDDDDDVNDETPGSFAVAGPAVRRSQQQQQASAVKAAPPPVMEDDDDDDLADISGDHHEKNLPVAFEAEVVFDYPNNQVVVAQKDEGSRTVPLRWLIMGGCCMFIAAVAISVGLGVALGGDSTTSSSDNANVAPPTTDPGVAPTFAPVVAPTFTPVVAPTFAPVVAPTFAPVDPGNPTFAPVVPPTFAPVDPPTFAPVDPPTFAPVDPPTFAPVVAPTFAPQVAPTFAPVVPPTFAPVVEPTFAPVPAPTFAPVTDPTTAPVEAPVEAPVDAPVTAPSGGSSSSSAVNPVYAGSSGRTCECRYYSQDIVVSDEADFASLDQGQLTSLIQILRSMVPNFDPYGLLRRQLLQVQPQEPDLVTTPTTSDCTLRGVGGGKGCGEDGRTTSNKYVHRQLEVTSVSFSLDLTDQSTFGTPPTDPFGIRIEYSWEFCVDDVTFVGDYHEAFKDYLDNGTNLAQMESDVRNDLGLSSLTEITTPDELTSQVCTG